MNFQQQLSQLGLTLPPPPKAVADYVPWVESGDLLYISGQLPLQAGALLATGKVGGVVDLPTAQHCAKICALNLLAILNEAIAGDFRGRLDRLIRLGVFVASAPDFTQQHLVANCASELLGQVLGAQGRHTRAAVGCVSLPLDAPVEIEAVFALRNPDGRSD